MRTARIRENTYVGSQLSVSFGMTYLYFLYTTLKSSSSNNNSARRVREIEIDNGPTEL
jgi:hypothetical protein